MRVAANAYEMDSIRSGIERLDLVNPEPEIRIAVRELNARRAKLTPLRVFSVIALYVRHGTDGRKTRAKQH
jgi:hypothetical protein